MNNSAIAEKLDNLGFPDVKRGYQFVGKENKDEIISRIMAMDANTSFPASNKVDVLNHTFFFESVWQVFNTPLTAEQIINVRQIGNWTDEYASLSVIEHVGHTRPYGDFDRQGASDVNRSSEAIRHYRFQDMLEIGDLESAMNSSNGPRGQIDLLAQKEEAAARVINRTHDRIWLFGVEYTTGDFVVPGLINNPDLDPSLTVTTPWATATADQIIADIDSLYTDLVTKSGGHITEDTPLTLALPNSLRAALNKRREYTDKTVLQVIEETYPNLTIVSSADFALESGNIVMLIAKTVTADNGAQLDAIIGGYSVRFQSHGKVRDVTSTIEKKSGGNWGTHVIYPWAISSLTGA